MKQNNLKIEKYRIVEGVLQSDKTYGNNGAFFIPTKDNGAMVIASDQDGWEHVSVSFTDRMPSWDDMCLIKDLFFDEEEVVIQYHPKKSEYVNNHPYCLHLWKPIGVVLPTPPTELVGIKNRNIRE